MFVQEITMTSEPHVPAWSEHDVSCVQGVGLQFVPECRVLHVRPQVKS